MSILLDALKKAAGTEEKAATSDEDGGASYPKALRMPSTKRPSRWIISGGVFFFIVFFFWWWNPVLENRPSSSSVPNPASQYSDGSVASGNRLAKSMSALTEGLSFFHGGDYAKALLKFQEAVTLNPDSAVAYNNLGLALKKTGRPKEASQAYEKALMLDPAYVEAMNNLAVLHILDNKTDEASRLFVNALRYRPEYPEVHLNYAVLLERSGNRGEAVEHYSAYLRFASPHDSMAVQIRDHIRQIQ